MKLLRLACGPMLCALCCTTATFAADPPHTGLGLNVVAFENEYAGTRAWVMRRPRVTRIEGYASEVSVAPGDTLHLHVSSSTGARYRVVVYRVGWYRGAGGRVFACVPRCTSSRAGTSQPIPSPDPSTGLLALNWPVTDAVSTGANWPSGYYLANLVLTQGADVGRGSWIPFVVRAPSSRSATILVQAAVNTWQAYNRWGGRSLYWNHTGVGDDLVSFDRPYDQRGMPRYAGPFANLPQAWSSHSCASSSDTATTSRTRQTSTRTATRTNSSGTSS